MNNRFRTELEREEDEAGGKLIVEEKTVREIPDNFFTQLFTRRFITSEKATSALPFVLYMAMLGMIYIGNMHMAEKAIRDIDDLTKEVKERGYDFKIAKADMAFKSTLSQVAGRADSLLNIRQSVEPPKKITVQKDQDGH